MYKSYLFFLLTFISTLAFGQGINFENSDFKTALAKATAENKIVFIDAYTTWCGPCKWMSKNVFTDEKVGTFYNDKFVNLKVDMEKGEGKDIARTYEVYAYPTLLFLDCTGKMLHISIGSRSVEEFLLLGEAAIDPERQVTTMTERYDAGERNPSFLKKYVDVITSAGIEGFDKVALEYMETQEDWTTDENTQFIFDYSEASMNSKLFQYSLKNQDRFRALIGDEGFDKKVHFAAFNDGAKNGLLDKKDYGTIYEHFKNYFAEDKAAFQAKATLIDLLMYDELPANQEKFLTETILFTASEPDMDWQFYNGVAWRFYELTKDQDYLLKAADWAQKSIEYEENSYNTDTKAHILYVIGRYDEAETMAKRSIALAQEEGNDPSATQALLEKILLKK